MQRVPQHIGCRFDVRRVLGVGGMSRVYLAYDRSDETLCAIKCASESQPEHVGALRREFSLRRRLGHPQIPAVRAFGRDDATETTWMTMDYVEGDDLVTSLANEARPQLPWLLAQALHVLAFLHERDVVHGDLKPENIVVSPSSAGSLRTLRLVDFGLALHASLPVPSTTGGTIAYMAPSLLRGATGSASTDLYALGRSFEEAVGDGSVDTSDSAPATAEARAVIARLVHPDEDLRYRTATDALHDLAASTPQAVEGLPPPTTAPLVGRDSQWSALGRALSELRAGALSKSVLLLRGVAGSGKTRLLVETHAEATLADLAVVSLRCERPAGAFEVARRLAERLLEPTDSLRREIESCWQDERVSGVKDTILPAGVLRDLLGSLQRVSMQRPLAILVDDYEHADESTQLLLSMAARTATARGPLWVVAGDGEHSTTRVLGAEAGVRALDVASLSTDAAAALIESLLTPGSAEPALARALAVVSEGNPRLGVLLARERSAIVDDASKVDAGLCDRLLASRVAAQDEEAQRLLLDLAVLLRAAPVPLIVTMSGTKASDVVTKLEALARVGLVESEWEGRRRRYAIASDLLRRHVLAAVGADAIRERHAAARRAWAAWPSQAERPSEMLLEHAIRAADVEHAVRPGLDLAKRLAAQGCLGTAEHVLRSLLPLAERHDAPALPRLQEQLCEVLLRAGQTEEARSRLHALSEHAEAGGPTDARRGARLLLMRGMVEDAAGHLPEARTALERVAELPLDVTTVADRMRAWERLGVVYFREGRHEDARRAWERGLEAFPADAAGPHLLLADLLNDLGALDTWQLRFEEARTRHEQALEIRRRAKDVDGESRSLTNLGNLALKQADFVAARDHYTASLALKRQVGSLRKQAISLVNLATVHNLLGDYGAALPLLEEGLDLRRRCSDTVGEAATRRQLAALYLNKGELEAAGEQLSMARTLLDAAGAGHAFTVPHAVQEAELLLLCGELARAEAHCTSAIEALPDRARATQTHELLLIRGRARLARSDLVGAAEDLRTAREGLETQGDRYARAWALVYEGLAHFERGHVPRARQMLEEAAKEGSALGARRLFAEAVLAVARLELAHGEEELASTALSKAAALAEHLGDPHLDFAVWAHQGVRAHQRGRLGHAVAWWRKCVVLLEEGLDRLGAAHDVEAYLTHPERGWVTSALAGLLDAMESPAESERNVPL